MKTLCTLIRDMDGWWIQWIDEKTGARTCILLAGVDSQKEAERIAGERGFNHIAVIS